MAPLPRLPDGILFQLLLFFSSTSLFSMTLKRSVHCARRCLWSTVHVPSVRHPGPSPRPVRRFYVLSHPFCRITLQGGGLTRFTAAEPEKKGSERPGRLPSCPGSSGPPGVGTQALTAPRSIHPVFGLPSSPTSCQTALDRRGVCVWGGLHFSSDVSSGSWIPSRSESLLGTVFLFGSAAVLSRKGEDADCRPCSSSHWDTPTGFVPAVGLWGLLAPSLPGERSDGSCPRAWCSSSLRWVARCFLRIPFGTRGLTWRCHLQKVPLADTVLPHGLGTQEAPTACALLARAVLSLSPLSQPGGNSARERVVQGGLSLPAAPEGRVPTFSRTVPETQAMSETPQGAKRRASPGPAHSRAQGSSENCGQS